MLTSDSLAAHGWVVQGVLYLETVSEALTLLPSQSIHILPMPARRRVALVTHFALREEGLVISVLVLALRILILRPAVNSVLALAPE